MQNLTNQAVIDQEHGQRAAEVVEDCISLILTGRKDQFNRPFMAIELLSIMMKSQMIQIWTREKHASELALSATFCFHRWMLYFVEKYPEILIQVDKMTEDFNNHEDCRSKKEVPDLGDFLCSFTISSYPWSQIADSYLQESSDRSMYQLLKNSKTKGRYTSDTSQLTAAEIQQVFQCVSSGSELRSTLLMIDSQSSTREISCLPSFLPPGDWAGKPISCRVG